MTQNNGSISVGVIGLGLLGTALAERLLDGGFRVTVFNRTREKADPLIERGARWSDRPLADCDRAVICLYTTEVVEAVLQQMDAHLRAGQILIDTTTGDPHQTRSLGERLAQRGVDYLESPIAASSEQTRQGQALAMVAGPESAYAACDDLFKVLTARSVHVGTWGDAAKMKLVNNLVLGLNRLALAEGLVFARAVGLDAETALDVLKQGNAHSVAMDVKGRKMVEGDFSLQARLSQHAKDVRLILAEAERSGVALPLSSLHLELLGEAAAAGFGEADNSAIIRAIEQRRAGRAKPDASKPE